MFFLFYSIRVFFYSKNIGSLQQRLKCIFHSSFLIKREFSAIWGGQEIMVPNLHPFWLSLLDHGLCQMTKWLARACWLGVIQQLCRPNFTQFWPPPPSSGQVWTLYMIPTLCHMTKHRLSTDPLTVCWNGVLCGHFLGIKM